MECFSEQAKQRLKYYVYALIDPRDNQVFYIGKGKDNRVFRHELDSKGDAETEKLERIRNILQDGLDVKKVVVHHGLSEDQAFAAEAALINLLAYQDSTALTNLVSGHYASEAMTTEDTERILGAEVLEEKDISHNLLVIKINSLYRIGMQDREVMDCARGHWVINTENAKKADYLLAVYHGLVVGMYENMIWYPSGEATPFYPYLCEENLKLTNRKYCTCKPVPAHSFAHKKYMGKNISSVVKSAQNPISYVWNRKNACASLQKYYDGFKNGFSSSLLFQEQFGEDMKALGFEMDSYARYDETGNGRDVLHSGDYTAICKSVADLDYTTVTSLLFSHWRQLTHWEYICPSPHDPEVSSFFLAVLERIFSLI